MPMNKAYSIQPSLFLVERLIQTIFRLILVLCWIAPFFLQAEMSLFRPHLFRISTYMTLMLIAIMLLLSMSFRELRKTVFLLTPEGIIKKTPYKIVTIPYAEITGFSFTSTLFGLGFGTVRSATKAIHLHSAIDNLESLITELRQKLETLSATPPFSPDNIDRFSRRAALWHFHGQQTSTLIPPLVIAIAASLCLSAVVSLFFWELPFILAFAWILYGLLMPIIGFIIAHLRITGQFVRHQRRNAHFDSGYWVSRLYTSTAVCITLFYLFTGILFKSYWLYFY